MKRFPIYILVGVSGSLIEEKTDKIKDCLEILKEELLCGVLTRSSFVTIILFNSTAEVAMRMMPLRNLQIPNLQVSGGGEHSFADAIDTLMQCYDADTIKRVMSPDNYDTADRESMLFVISDGVFAKKPEALQVIGKFNSKYSRKFTNACCVCVHASSASKEDRTLRCENLRHLVEAMFRDVIEQENNLPEFMKNTFDVDDLSPAAYASLRACQYMESIGKACDFSVFTIPY